MTIALGACADPEQNTDLRPDGPPEVLAVLVMNDPAGQIVEKATYCQPGDEKRPQAVGLPDFTLRDICPADVTKGVDEVEDAWPDGWYVRIMFDELLDPNIEELTEIKDPDSGEGTDMYTGSIANTHPVKLECESIGGGFVEVDYDGYYSPSGNAVTWPLGPSLVIKPNEPRSIATGKECKVTLLDVITDKSGEKVPSDQRDFKFKVAPITVIATDPADSGDPASPSPVDALSLYFDNPIFSFNTEVTQTSICADTDSATAGDGGAGLCDQGTENVEVTPAVTAAAAGGLWGVCNISGDLCSTMADCAAPDTRCDQSYAYTLSGLPLGTDLGFGLLTPFETDKDYTITLKQGAKFTDRCGVETTLGEPSADELTSISVHTTKFDFVSSKPGTGDLTAMVAKPTLTFTNVIDASTLASTEYSITPSPAGFAIKQVSGGDIVFGGNYAPDTEYTLTINANATVEDWYGKEYKFPEEKKITFKTQAKVTASSFSPAADSTIQKVLNVQPVGVTIGFNANMDPATFTAADFTFVNSHGVAVSTLPMYSISTGSSASFANCAVGSLSCQLRVRADLPPDTYTFTLLAGAQISDTLGNVYSPGADKVIHFAVKAPPPPVQCL